MRGRVPDTGFPHVLGVCGEAPRLHERDRHCIGAPQPPGSEGAAGQGQGVLPEARRAYGYGHLLVEESLFRTSHPPCEVGGLVPMRNDAKPQRKVPVPEQGFGVSWTGPLTL